MICWNSFCARHCSSVLWLMYKRVCNVASILIRPPILPWLTAISLLWRMFFVAVDDCRHETGRMCGTEKEALSDVALM